MELKHIEIEQLTPSKLNMRHGKKPPKIDDILPSIRKVGIFVPLLVRPNGSDDHYEIVAGRRRYFCAMKVIEEQGEMEPLPCAVMAPGDDAAALEASLLENSARLDPDPMTQHVTFARLVKEGRNPADIAETFGLTEIMVERRLALGNLLPKIREAYQDDKIHDSTVRYLTMATAKQQRDWFKLFEDPEEYAPQGAQLKGFLFKGEDIKTDAALFPLEQYKGRLVNDLFGDNAHFADPAKFWKLQNEAIGAKRDAYLAGGWAEVEILEPGRRFQSYDHENVEQQDGGRVYIDVAHSGQVDFHEGYLTIKEASRRRRAKERAEQKAEGRNETPARCEMTKAMLNYLELHRHAVVTAEMLKHPKIALRLMVAHAIARSSLWRIEPEPKQANSGEIAESVSTSKANAALSEELKEVLALLDLDPTSTLIRTSYRGPTTTELFAKLLDLSDAKVMRVLTYAMAESLDVGSPLVEAVGNHVKVDSAAYWQPDDVFLDLLKGRNVVNAVLADVAGKSVADQNLTSKVAVQSSIIRDFLNGENGRVKVEGWQPRYMAFPFAAYTANGGIRIEEAWKQAQNPKQST